MRNTKIIATIGPASSSPESIEALVAAGVDVFRLNFSHGTHETHAATFALVREAAKRARRYVGIMQDLSGPKIRTGPLTRNQPVVLEQGGVLVISAGTEPTEPGRVFTPYAELIRSANPGDRLLLDDGRIELKVTGRSADGLVTEVVHGGTLGANKGINAPGVALPPSALTSKDIVDLKFGMSLGVDLVALSFVQTAQDVARAREIITQAGRNTPIVAKIERPTAVRNLDEILRFAQGVMVARGDLGLELPLEQVPRVQRDVIAKARSHGVPAIVATQVFESMRAEPRPTRAEVSDAAHAVGEGADAIMLAGETAAGAFPIRTVQTLDTVIRAAESVPSANHVLPTIDLAVNRHAPALSEAAVTLSTTAAADAIVAVTRGGMTPRLLSALRPAAPILAATPDEDVAGLLTLLWGVVPCITNERDVERLQTELLERGRLAPGSLVVFISVSTEQHATDANFIHVRRLGVG